jgi:hypothetical protein
MKYVKKWSGRPVPLEDESLSSWFRRLASANGLTPDELYSILLPGGRLYSYDLDRFACPSLFDALEEVTEISKVRLQKMTLHRWNHVLLGTNLNTQKLRWRPTAWREGTSRSYGQQICPTCLMSDEAPYYRTHWRLSFLTVCPAHGRLLVDRCPNCGDGVQVLKAGLIQHAHTRCWRCSFDFLQIEPCDSHHTSTTTPLDDALSSGWGFIGEYGYTHSIIYFEHLSILYRLLVSGRAAFPLRRLLAQITNITELSTTNIPRLKEADRLNTRARNLVLLAASKLLETWPSTFVDVCQSAKIYSGTLLKGNRIYPFAYEDAVTRHLSRGTIKTHEEEVVAVAQILARQKLQPTVKALEHLMGRKFSVPTSVVVPGRQCAPYGTNRYWKLDGVSPEVRTAARAAAKVAGENIGAWVDNTLRRVLTENT